MISLLMFLTMNKQMPLEGGLFRRIEVQLMQPLNEEILLNRPQFSCPLLREVIQCKGPAMALKGCLFCGKGYHDAWTFISTFRQVLLFVLTWWRVTKLACLEKWYCMIDTPFCHAISRGFPELIHFAEEDIGMAMATLLCGALTKGQE